MENRPKAILKVFCLDFIVLQETAGLKVGVSSRINEWLTKTPESNKSPAPKPSVSEFGTTTSSVGGFSPGAEGDGLWRSSASCPLGSSQRLSGC